MHRRTPSSHEEETAGSVAESCPPMAASVRNPRNAAADVGYQRDGDRRLLLRPYAARRQELPAGIHPLYCGFAAPAFGGGQHCGGNLAAEAATSTIARSPMGPM
jgi:hypothetical protein